MLSRRDRTNKIVPRDRILAKRPCVYANSNDKKSISGKTGVGKSDGSEARKTLILSDWVPSPSCKRFACYNVFGHALVSVNRHPTAELTRGRAAG